MLTTKEQLQTRRNITDSGKVQQGESNDTELRSFVIQGHVTDSR